MARVGSIGFQVNLIIKSHNGIGESKLKTRNSTGLVGANNQLISDKFHSYKSLDNARRDLTNLGKFAKELGIKDMQNIDKEVVQKWLNSKEDLKYRTASNYLSEIGKVKEHLSISKDDIKELRTELKENLVKTGELHNSTRAYKNLDKITLPERSQIAFELQRDYGLRANEASHINLNRQLVGNILSYQQKGGKLSQKELSTNLALKIRENAVEGKYEVNLKTYSRDLKKEIEKSGQKYNGTHGIRHTFAQNQLLAGKTKQEVSEMMGHTREEITNVYLR